MRYQYVDYMRNVLTGDICWVWRFGCNSQENFTVQHNSAMIRGSWVCAGSLINLTL